MKLSNQVKPISTLKAQAPEIIRDLSEHKNPVIITVHGEARAVLQDIDEYEEMQETLALLKIIALGKRQVEAGETYSLQEVIDSLHDEQT